VLILASTHSTDLLAVNRKILYNLLSTEGLFLSTTNRLAAHARGGGRLQRFPRPPSSISWTNGMGSPRKVGEEGRPNEERGGRRERGWWWWNKGGI